MQTQLQEDQHTTISPDRSPLSPGSFLVPRDAGQPSGSIFRILRYLRQSIEPDTCLVVFLILNPARIHGNPGCIRVRRPVQGAMRRLNKPKRGGSLCRGDQNTVRIKLCSSSSYLAEERSRLAGWNHRNGAVKDEIAACVVVRPVGEVLSA